MQQYEKEINALKLKNAYLKRQIEFESSIYKKVVFTGSTTIASIIAVLLIVRPANILDSIVWGFPIAVLTTVIRFTAEFIGRALWRRIKR